MVYGVRFSTVLLDNPVAAYQDDTLDLHLYTYYLLVLACDVVCAYVYSLLEVGLPQVGHCLDYICILLMVVCWLQNFGLVLVHWQWRPKN